MNKYQSRWKCEMCGRKISYKVSPLNDVCNRCKNKNIPNLYSLNKVPEQYFEFEKIKVEGIKLEV
jgi:ribosome-binding protein aMBF1 (putative translation factor)